MHYDVASGERLTSIDPDAISVGAWSLDPAQWVAGACAVAGRNLTRAEWDQYLGDLAPYHETCPEFEPAT